MKRRFLILFILIPSLTFCATLSSTFKNKQEMHSKMEELADEYEYVFIRYESFPMMPCSSYPAYGLVDTSLGPSFVYVKNENESIAFIFTNEGRLFDDPNIFFIETWENWFKYYVSMDKPKLQKSHIEYEIDSPEFKLLKEMNKR